MNVLVSSSRSLNVDMEWLYGASESSNMEVDIGYLPQVGSSVRCCTCTLVTHQNISHGSPVALASAVAARAVSTPLECLDVSLMFPARLQRHCPWLPTLLTRIVICGTFVSESELQESRDLCKIFTFIKN